MQVSPLALLLVLLGGPETPLPPLSGVLTGTVVNYDVRAGDSFPAIAARFGVDVATILRENAIARGRPLEPGARLRIPAVHVVPAAGALVVNVPQRLLFLAGADGSVRAFPIAVGRRDWPTPIGEFRVVRKEEHPTWDVPLSIQNEMRREGKTPLTRVPPSPGNPLGDYWIGLSLPGIGIHSTNLPRSIYRVATHGCIRVHPERMRELFDAVEEGTAGRIIYEPLLVAVVHDRVYLEAHADVYRRAPDAVTVLRGLAGRDCLSARIDWARALNAIALHEGIAIDVSPHR